MFQNDIPQAVDSQEITQINFLTAGVVNGSRLSLLSTTLAELEQSVMLATMDLLANNKALKLMLEVWQYEM